MIKTALFTPGPKSRWGLPILFEGDPGTGKTSMVEGEGHALGLQVTTLIASLREPSDFLGLPIPVDGRTTYAIPDWAYLLSKSKGGVCFIDEITTAAPAVQAALLRVILDGAVGEFTLPPTVRFAAACNPANMAAGGYDLAPPLANRFGHFKWESPDAEEWGRWLMSAGGAGEEEVEVLNAEKEQKRVLDNWDGPFARARGLVSAFLRSKPDLLLKMPKAASPELSKAWPSPRTWEFATRAMAGAEVHGLGVGDSEEIVAAFVGVGAAAELATYKAKADLPNPEDVLDGKIKFTHDPRRLDRTVAVLNSCTALVTSPKADKRDARASKLWSIMGEMLAESADLVVPAGTALVRAKLSVGNPALQAAARTVLVKLQPILEQAGVR